MLLNKIDHHLPGDKMAHQPAEVIEIAGEAVHEVQLARPDVLRAGGEIGRWVFPP